MAAAHPMPSSAFAEGDEEAVASVLDLLAVPPLELGPQRAVVPLQQRFPRGVAHGLGQSRRVHDVGEQERADGSSPLGPCGSDVEVDRDAELVDQAGGGLELEARARVVSVGGQGPREQHARLSGFVWGVDFAPGADPLPQGGDRFLGVAAMERQMPARDCRRGRRSRGAEPSGQVLQLGEALGRRLLVAHRHARRDVHGEEEDAALSSEEAGVLERAAEAAHRRPGIALRQQQATPPRLAVVAQSDGLRRVPLRRRPGRRDAPGSRPARCTPSPRCTG